VDTVAKQGVFGLIGEKLTKTKAYGNSVQVWPTREFSLDTVFTFRIKGLTQKMANCPALSENI
jgi:hypothetical protein